MFEFEGESDLGGEAVGFVLMDSAVMTGLFVGLIRVAVKILRLVSALSAEFVGVELSDNGEWDVSPSEKTGNENAVFVENAFCPVL